MAECVPGGFELFGSSSNCGSLLPGMKGSAISSSRSGGLATGRGGAVRVLMQFEVTSRE